MRRELRKCIGQLSFDKQGNQIVVSFLFTLLSTLQTLTKAPPPQIDQKNKQCPQGGAGKSSWQSND